MGAAAGAGDLRPTTFNRHLGNVYPALAMLAGMQLEVFTPLAAGPLSVDELAARLAVQPRKLKPLLYALVVGGLLEVDGERFANTAESNEFLVVGKPRYLGGTHGAYADLWSASLHTAASIRSGQPQARHDFAAMSHAELKAFMLGLDAGATATARRLNKDFGIGGAMQVLDAGGGAGGLAIALCELEPALHATVGELGNVAPIARECVAEAGLGARVTVIECDLVSAPPPGAYDAVIMRALLQVMSAEHARLTVRHGAATLKPGGGLYIVGRTLDDTRLSPLDAVAANVMFLNIYDDGQAYTESEYRGWLADAGLGDIQRRELAGGYSIIHGRKA
ncbi:MAG: methyltransferase [Proteobacteria bacterium]|nr:methyltransferase [Pseudomonadota bacterium]